MRGERNKVYGTGTGTDLSLVRATDDAFTDQVCTTSDAENRPDEVDALVNAFLDELRALSGECGVSSDPSSRTNPASATGSDNRAVTSTARSEASGIVLHLESEAVRIGQDVESASTRNPMEEDPPKVVELAPPPEAETVDAGQCRTKPHAIDQALSSRCAPEGAVEGNDTLKMRLTALPLPAVAGPSPRDDASLRDLLRGRRRGRVSVYSIAVLAVMSIAGLAAGYFFFGFTGPTPSRANRSYSQPSPTQAPVRTDLPGDGEMPIWPAGSDDLPKPGTGVTVVQEDAGVLQITQPVPIKKVMPLFPSEARSLGIDRPVEVDVSADLDDTGKVLRATAVQGPPVFRSAAEQALMKWAFKPAADKGINIRSTVRVTIVFKP